MKVATSTLISFVILSSHCLAGEREILVCDQVPDQYNNFKRSHLTIYENESKGFSFIAKQCQNTEETDCSLGSTLSYERFGELEQLGPTYANDNVTVTLVCGMQHFKDVSNRVYMQFQPAECDLSPSF